MSASVKLPGPPPPPPWNPLTKRPFSDKFHELEKLVQKLPVSQNLRPLPRTFKQNNVMIVVGETGSGKTTQIPKNILKYMPLRKKIVVTQPHRLAAQLCAERIAEELDDSLGHAVGLKYRGVSQTSKDTRLEVVTDGTFLETAMLDPQLSEYEIVIVDEAHQHSKPTDLLLGLLKPLLLTRKDLKVVIMSATINPALFQAFFPSSVVYEVPGGVHKVIVEYLVSPPRSDLVETVAAQILRVHREERPGDILVFVPSVSEITKIIKWVEFALSGQDPRFPLDEMGAMRCWALHAGLSLEEQHIVVEDVRPAPRRGKDRQIRHGRKLIVATNIAETSITVSGVTLVIDSCKVKCRIWNARTESWSLQQICVSKATAKQRAGRAGRVREGKVIRMCTQAEFDDYFPEHSTPSILEGDLLDECLQIYRLGFSPYKFPYIVAPANEVIARAISILWRLGAVSSLGDLTKLGQEMSMLPVDVYAAKTILASVKYQCSDQAVSLAAIMAGSEDGKTLFLRPKDDDPEAIRKLKRAQAHFRHVTGDHLTLFNIYMAWRYASDSGESEKFLKDNMLLGSVLKSADRTRKQLIQILMEKEPFKGAFIFFSKENHEPDFYIAILKALAAGNFLRVAKRTPAASPLIFDTVRGNFPVKLAQSSTLCHSEEEDKWVVYGEYYNDGPRREIRLVSSIPIEFIVQSSPLFWRRVQFFPDGHIKKSLVEVLANMTGFPQSLIANGPARRATFST